MAVIYRNDKYDTAIRPLCIDNEDELLLAALFCHSLYVIEGESEPCSPFRSSAEAAAALIEHVANHGPESVLVAEDEVGAVIVGCIIMAFHAADVEVGGLYVNPTAPQKTSVWLMYAASMVVSSRGYTDVKIAVSLVGERGDRTRKTYEAMGLIPTVTVYKGDVVTAREALLKRM